MQFEWDVIARENLQLYAQDDIPLREAFMAELAQLHTGAVLGMAVRRQQGTAYVIFVRVSGRDTEYMLVWHEASVGRRRVVYCGPRLAGM